MLTQSEEHCICTGYWLDIESLFGTKPVPASHRSFLIQPSQNGRATWHKTLETAQKAEPLRDRGSAAQPGRQALQMEQSVYNKSSYSQGSHSLEDQRFCYCVTEREFGVIDTWCVRKEHNVGPRERCSVGMKNIVPPPNICHLCLCPKCGFFCFSHNVF